MTYRSILALLAVASGAAAACSSGDTDVATTSSSASTSHTSSASSAAGGSGGATTSATTTSSTASGGAVSAMKACADAVKARCERLDGCENMKGVVIQYGDEATCESRGLPSCLDGLNATGTSATAAHDEACATDVASQTCVDFFDNVQPAACVPTAGSLANGAACGAAAQCQSTYCTLSKDKVCGLCADLPKAGDACSSNPDCGRDFICVNSGGTSSTCAVPVADNGPCLRPDDCQGGSTCVGGDPTTNKTGTCQPKVAALGAACDASRKTKPDCDGHQQLYCAAFDSVCHAETLVPAGMPCGLTATGANTAFAVCTGGALCVGFMGSTPGTCVAVAADGAGCDDAAGPPCLQPSKCVNKVCTSPKPSTCQ